MSKRALRGCEPLVRARLILTELERREVPVTRLNFTFQPAVGHTLSATQQEYLEIAGNILATHIAGGTADSTEQTVSVRVEVQNASLGSSTLAVAGPAYYTFLGYHPTGAAVMEAGAETVTRTLSPPIGSTAEIQLALNSNPAVVSSTFFDPAKYDRFGPLTAPVPSNKIDFISVTMHELMHGLGFIGFRDQSLNNGAWNYPAPIFEMTEYDAFLSRSSPTATDWTFGGPAASIANAGQPVPVEVTNASNYYHLAQSQNDLMYFQLPTGTRKSLFATAGNVVSVDGGVLHDIGWNFSRTGVADGMGIYNPSSGQWFLDNLPGHPASGIPTFNYGGSNWTPVVGDWNGDGTSTVGVVETTATGTLKWHLRNSNSAGGASITAFEYGAAGMIPVVGDWDGDGKDTIGVVTVQNGQLVWVLRNDNSAGAANSIFNYGGQDWTPVVGDWDGDGRTTIGAVQKVGGVLRWQLRNSNDAGTPNVVFDYGSDQWTPVVGDWNKDGQTTIGAISTTTTVGGNQVLQWQLRNANNGGAVDILFNYGVPGWKPVTGHWKKATYGDWGGDVYEGQGWGGSLMQAPSGGGESFAQSGGVAWSTAGLSSAPALLSFPTAGSWQSFQTTPAGQQTPTGVGVEAPQSDELSQWSSGSPSAESELPTILAVSVTDAWSVRGVREMRNPNAGDWLADAFRKDVGGVFVG